jgi:hypothetical protein
MKNRSIIWLAMLSPGFLSAQNAYQQPEEAFIAEAFQGTAPAPRTLWLNNDVQTEIRPILGHDLRKLRLTYWVQGTRSAWILDEIGKERPITTGIVINENKIENIKVLVYRESRGWEVKHSFFTNQFKGTSLSGNKELDRGIDNISGATLSVRALTKLARLALYLHGRYAAS